MALASKPCLIPAGPRGFGGAYTNYERDSLEDALLPWLAPRERGTVLDLGCGHGGLAVRMARQGHDIVCQDIQPECVEASRAHFAENGLSASFRGVCGAMEDGGPWQDRPEGGYLAVTLMRSLIWVPAASAAKALEHARTSLAEDGRVWFIVLGTEAPIVPDAHRALPVERRFATIAAGDAERINMHRPITAYSAGELADLFSGAGLRIAESRTTEYGHHKGYAVAAR